METNSVQISLCGFIRHTQPFRQLYRSGLDTYIIRLQAEGECEVLIDGEMTAVVPGDLLLFKPYDIYDLRIGEKKSPLGHSVDYFVMCTGNGWTTGGTCVSDPKRLELRMMVSCKVYGNSLIWRIED